VLIRCVMKTVCNVGVSRRTEHEGQKGEHVGGVGPEGWQVNEEGLERVHPPQQKGKAMAGHVDRTRQELAME
jgi:hypothetical protein